MATMHSQIWWWKTWIHSVEERMKRSKKTQYDAHLRHVSWVRALLNSLCYNYHLVHKQNCLHSFSSLSSVPLSLSGSVTAAAALLTSFFAYFSLFFTAQIMLATQNESERKREREREREFLLPSHLILPSCSSSLLFLVHVNRSC